ncbi:hypothetical protein [Ornithinimicrobium kibberense]|uniref:hypothetical protein n=1 Tax=Ornithinimicrobium kibberense TaxID=282060 RepID=UPI003605DB4E
MRLQPLALVRPHHAQERGGGRLALLHLVVVDGVHVLQQGELARAHGGPVRGEAGQLQVLGGGGPVATGGRDDAQLHHPTGGGRVGRVEVHAGLPSPVRLVRAQVGDDVLADGHVREVEDDIRPLGRGHQQTQAVLRQVVRRGQEAAVVADLVGPDPGDAGEVEDEEARAAAVEQPQPVAPLLDLVEGPRPAVDDERVPEELRVPDGVDGAVGHVGTLVAVEEGPGVRVEQRPVGVERAVLDRQRQLVGRHPTPAARTDRGVGRQHRAPAGPGVGDLVLAVRASPQQVEAGGPGIHVEPGDAQGVVVEPQGGVAVVVGVVGDLLAAPPHLAVALEGPAGEELVPGAVLGVLAKVPRVREVPGLRVAVGLVAHAHRPVQVDDHRDRALVGGVLGVRVHGLARRHVGQAGEIGADVGARHAVRPRPRPQVGVGPVQGGVDGQQVGQGPALVVDEVVDPPDPHRDAVRRLDRHRRGVVEPPAHPSVGRPVAPDGRRRVLLGQHLLGELPHRDVVVVDRAALRSAASRARHGRRHEQWRGERPDVAGRERAPRQLLGHDPAHAGDRVGDDEGERARGRPGEEGTAGNLVHRDHLGQVGRRTPAPAPNAGVGE